MPDAVYTDDKGGAGWDSQVLDAGRTGRSAFRDLARFAKGLPAKLWRAARRHVDDLAAMMGTSR